VKRFDIGEVVPYDRRALLDAVERLSSPDRQADIRERSARLAPPQFDVAGAYKYLTEAAQQGGHIAQPRFEPLLPPLAGEFSVYQEAPIPAHVYRDFVETYRSLGRVAAHGYRPDFVIDAGASTGIWSFYIGDVLPKARFLLVDLLSPDTRRSGTSPGSLLRLLRSPTRQAA
jgi:hypothetical protein